MSGLKICGLRVQVLQVSKTEIELMGLLRDAGATLRIGLKQQGHLETVARMVADGATWDEIGAAIHWSGAAAKRWYEMETGTPSGAVEFTVYGTPRPQGSMRQFAIKTPTGPHYVMTSANRQLKPWRQQVSGEALTQRTESFSCLNEKPVALTLNFYFKRPKSAPKSRVMPTVKPDTDKLIRAILDALTGILYHDDAQVVKVTAMKHYGDPERVEIRVEEAVC